MKSEESINEMVVHLESVSQMDKNVRYGWLAALRWILINEKEIGKHEK